MTGKIVTLAELVEILDVSPKAVRDMLISPSFPIHEKGRRGKSHLFDTAAVINWLKERERKRAAEKPNRDNDGRDKLAAIKIQRAELELKRATGTLFDLNDWGPFIRDKMLAFRQSMDTVAINTREKFGSEVAKFVDKEITAAINAYHRGLSGIPDNEAKRV